MKTEIQMEKTHCNIRGNYVHQRNEVKEKIWPVFFFYIGTKFEHQFKDRYASQKVLVFSSLHRPVTHFRHAQGHQRAGA